MRKHLKIDDLDQGLQLGEKTFISDGHYSVDVAWTKYTKEDVPVNRAETWKNPADGSVILRVGFFKNMGELDASTKQVK